MGNSYTILLEKINEFTRKFYLNKLLRGTIYCAAGILGIYLLLFLFIYFARPAVLTKTLLFFAFSGGCLFACAIFIIRPMLSYFRVGKLISAEQAALLIGEHFQSVKDKLLNAIQLKDLAGQSAENHDLIIAGIDQKIAELRPVPFTQAIRFSDNRKYLKFVLFPLAVILSIGLLAPAILWQGTNSFIRYNEEVLPEAPFNFIVLNKSLSVTQGDDLAVSLKLTGNDFPSDIYVEDGLNTYKLEKENNSLFHYLFKNLQQNKTLRFHGGGFNSSPVYITVNPRPGLLDMQAELIFPAYLNKKTALVPHAGDLLIPEGTRVTWSFHTENSSSVGFIWQEKQHPLDVKNNQATFSAIIRKPGIYRVTPYNNFGASKDSLSHFITIVKDQLPLINVVENTDSISRKALYFSGELSDDYGFSALYFKYQVQEEGKVVRNAQIPVNIRKNQTEDRFFYWWDLNTIDLKPGQNLSYFFEIWDNDGVNGPKASKSEIRSYHVASAQEMAATLAKGNDALKKKMEDAIKLAATIEKESKKVSQQLLDKKQLSFEDKKQIEQLLEKQRELEKAVSEIKKQNEKNSYQKEESNTLTDELKEKQKQIDDLFKNGLDEKTKELLEKLQRLMELNSKDLTREELSKMQLDNKSLKNELDRVLELYKQLEFEQTLQQKTQRLNELAQQQKELSKESRDKQQDAVNISKKQEELNSDFQNLKDELETLDKKNQALERPNNFHNPEQETSNIEKKQQESKELLQKNDRTKAAEKQNEAAEGMEKLAQKLNEEQQASEEQETSLNAKVLRRLLKNLVTMSVDQENLMLSLRKSAIDDPAYVTKTQQQNSIKANMKMIADSLFSLSKRVPQLEHTVNTEVERINYNLEKTIEQLGERRTAEANRFQQTTMTSLNNLALMLNEALESLQKNQRNGRGKGKSSMQQLQKMQEQLNKNMQNAKDKLEQSPNRGTVPKGEMSRDFVEMAKQQQLIREALQKINSEDNKDGKGPLGNLNQLIQDMKKTENDLVNKRIYQETMNRQKDLLTKLLDADKAQREQDEEAKRESKAGKDFPPSYQQMLEQFKKQQQSDTEMLQKFPPQLNPYYRNKIAEYFKILNGMP